MHETQKPKPSQPPTPPQKPYLPSIPSKIPRTLASIALGLAISTTITLSTKDETSTPLFFISVLLTLIDIALLFQILLDVIKLTRALAFTALAMESVALLLLAIGEFEGGGGHFDLTIFTILACLVLLPVPWVVLGV